jgi:endonuclease YncB( thermonuclease family)
VVLAGAAVLASWFDPAPAALSGAARPGDGDSFHLGGDRVRLLGIDAPEYAQTCTGSDGHAWPCGRSARDRLAGLLKGGAVQCQPEGRDKYQRVLAVCQVAGTDIGRLMVAEGLAISSGRYAGEERAARSSRRGIWAGSFDTPRDWRDGRQGADLWGWIVSLFQ